MSNATPAHLPLTSVIMVSFHTGPSLFVAIDSVLNQIAPVELVLVNNGNPEEVVKALKDKAVNETRMILVDGHGNVGFGQGNNLGVKASHGDYLLILNPDSQLHDDTLAKLQGQTSVLPPPHMIGARILNKDGTDQRGCRRELLTPTTSFVEALHLGGLFPQFRLNRHTEPLPTTTAPVPAISGAFMFLSRKGYNSIGGFDEGYFLHVEDLDLCFRFRKAGGEIFFAPEITITHIGGTSKTTSDFIERHKARSFVHYFHSNFGDNYPIIFLWCLDIAIWGRYLLRRLMNYLTPRSSVTE